VLRPRLAGAFTIVPRGDAVWLISGEDVRFTLRGDAAASWLPELLRACDGTLTLDAVVACAPAAHQAEARELLTGLAGERVIVDGGAALAHRPAPPAWQVEGTGRLAEALRPRAPGGALRVIAQDTLDFPAALAANARQLAGTTRWLWASIGPQARAFVGPLFLPDAGPCLECLLDHFRLRSPVPELYDLLAAHPGPFAPAAFDDEPLAIVADLVAAKLALVARDPAPAALYALHVVEAATLEVSSHRVLINPECPACGKRGT
jgi:bacteriocin biosynthesis cyclodehydratase domain-containing protein